MQNETDITKSKSKYINLSTDINKNTTTKYMKSISSSNSSDVSSLSKMDQGIGKFLYSTTKFKAINDKNLSTIEKKDIFDIIYTRIVANVSEKINNIDISNKNKTHEIIINIQSINYMKFQYKNISHNSCILNFLEISILIICI